MSVRENTKLALFNSIQNQPNFYKLFLEGCYHVRQLTRENKRTGSFEN